MCPQNWRQYWRHNQNPVNKLITLKINVLANITITKTSVLVVYLLVYHSIYYPPLLCTSCDVSKICLSPMYNVVEFSPNDQIQPKLFVSINSADIYISSDKFVLNKSIYMELRFNTFPLSWWYNNILENFQRFWAIAHLRGVFKKTGSSGNSPVIQVKTLPHDSATGPGKTLSHIRVPWAEWFSSPNKHLSWIFWLIQFKM
jgi:hypothetical protein